MIRRRSLPTVAAGCCGQCGRRRYRGRARRRRRDRASGPLADPASAIAAASTGPAWVTPGAGGAGAAAEPRKGPPPAWRAPGGAGERGAGRRRGRRAWPGRAVRDAPGRARRDRLVPGGLTRLTLGRNQAARRRARSAGHRRRADHRQRRAANRAGRPRGRAPALDPAGDGGQPAGMVRLRAGDLITTAQAAAAARLARGGSYPVAAAVSTRITAGGTALLGVAGVDGVVSEAEGKKLGLARNVAVLVNAPAADMTALAAQVQAALGASARVVRLVPVAASTSLPVDTTLRPAAPANYLQLFQASAARYCPGLSWTVLAAIGQIESADGQNVGPSTAGALGPMQFLPSTWATWGIDGFGDTGPPDIMNPFDAVPSAARPAVRRRRDQRRGRAKAGDLRLQPRELGTWTRSSPWPPSTPASTELPAGGRPPCTPRHGGASPLHSLPTGTPPRTRRPRAVAGVKAL